MPSNPLETSLIGSIKNPLPIFPGTKNIDPPRLPDLRVYRGLRNQENRKSFFDILGNAQAKVLALRRGKHDGSIDPTEPLFNPLKLIVHLKGMGRMDEAVWLAFLVVHFGPLKGTDKWESIRNFYSKFGKGQLRWKGVFRNPKSIKDWLLRCRVQWQELQFGNHRKYETKKLASSKGTPAVIKDFCEWAGTSPNQRICTVLKGTPEASFANIYGSLQIRRFGRTAKFDFLCLLGNLGIYSLSPGHCYLKGSIGPRAGAIMVCTGRRGGKLTEYIEQRIIDLQMLLQCQVEALEDTLCIWQKKKAGFISSFC